MKAIANILIIIFILIKESVFFSFINLLYSKKHNREEYNIKLRNFGKALCNCLPKMGPAFVKLGQFISTRHDLVHHIICHELEHLQDKAPTISFSKIKKILVQELSTTYDNIDIDPTPIAAASIAQVHRGRIVIKGIQKDVAIKILRPNIRKKFLENIDMMMSIASFINRFINPAKKLRLEEVVGVIAETAKSELDMRIEASAADKLRYNSKGREGMYIPKVFWDYITKSVLVMEWIDGRKITALNVDEGKDIAQKLAYNFFHQAYVDGFFHADIHPGNILVDKHNRIVLIDFGMFSYLPENDRLFVAEIIYAFIKKDYEKVSDLHFEAGYVPLEGSMYQRHMFALACRSIAGPIFGKSTAEISVSKLLRRLFEVASEFEMHTQPQLLLLQKNLMLLEGVLNLLYPGINMWLLVEPWFTEWARKNLNFIAKASRKYKQIVANLEILEKKLREE
jgi:ubiquinone biosynthesis protein